MKHFKKSILLGMSEITADHPEVQAMVEEAIKSASVSEVTLAPEIYAEVLERAIAEVKQVLCRKALFFLGRPVTVFTLSYMFLIFPFKRSV